MLSRRFLSVAASPGKVVVKAPAFQAPFNCEGKTVADSRDKIEKAVLFEELNATNRRLLFKPSKAHLLGPDQTLTTRDGKVLHPTVYRGVPGSCDILTLVENGDAKELCPILEKLAKHSTTARNVHPYHFSALLRRAAEQGSYEEVWQYLTVRSTLKKYLTTDIYLDALRIVALRIPAKSKDSRKLLLKLYQKAAPGLSRELALLYGLDKYQQKFGHTESLIDATSQRIAELAGSSAEPLDLALGITASEELHLDSVAKALKSSEGDFESTDALTVAVETVEKDESPSQDEEAVPQA